MGFGQKPVKEVVMTIVGGEIRYRDGEIVRLTEGATRGAGAR